MKARKLRVWSYPREMIESIGHQYNESLRFPADMTEEVDSPSGADVIRVMADLAKFDSRDALLRLPHFAQHEARHVAYDCCDSYVLYHSSALLMRCNLNAERLADSPNSISWPWPTEDWGALGASRLPDEGFTHDLGFVGWDYSETCKRAVASCRRVLGDRFACTTFPDFAGYLWKDGKPLPEFTRRRELMIDNVRRCRLQLCAESIPGVLRYRVTEAMSAGRVPVIVTSTAVLPWADVLPWEDVALFVRVEDVDRTGDAVRDWLAGRPDHEILSWGDYARTLWRAWLNVGPQSNFADLLMLKAVERKTRALGLVRDEA